ncbi:Fis family transcriptional regulator [Enterococcus hirae]|nr:Fis family transcriptional regulator [Enterococcus hirae]
MDIQKLIDLYPNAQKKNFPASDKKILSLVVEDSFLWIEKNSLSHQEMKLLKTLFQTTNHLQNHPWYHYLFETKTYILEESYRIIQIHIEARGDFLQEEWQQTISEIFPHLTDFFFYTEKDALMIEKRNKDYLDTLELKGVFLTLDADFDITTQAFVGSFHPPKQNIVAVFSEERKIFFSERDHLQTYGKTISIQEIALYYYTREINASSQLVTEYQELIQYHKMNKIILELWKNLGNISSTAKTLYMHRNTLKYRIEKFYEQSGFNLKKPDDLLFCYLLLLHS